MVQRILVNDARTVILCETRWGRLGGLQTSKEEERNHNTADGFDDDYLLRSLFESCKATKNSSRELLAQLVECARDGTSCSEETNRKCQRQYKVRAATARSSNTKTSHHKCHKRGIDRKYRYAHFLFELCVAHMDLVSDALMSAAQTNKQIGNTSRQTEIEIESKCSLQAHTQPT